MKAATISSRGDVVYEADVEHGVREIDVARVTDKNGYPVNRAKMRVSRSKRNLKKARDCELISRRQGTDALGHTCEFYS